jgi:hypothetical protein
MVQAWMERSMRGKWVLAAMAAATIAGAAYAAKLDMRGVLDGEGVPWRECIEPGGKTVYWFRGAVDRGRLTIRGDGALCFSYESRNFEDAACFFAEPIAGGNFRFTEDFPTDPSVFVTQSVRRVKACTADVPVS